ncbi:MAG: mechanosensitive ion channel family protein [Candidatus Cyclobacteriaceae bacterium M3_2C_046]
MDTASLEKFSTELDPLVWNLILLASGITLGLIIKFIVFKIIKVTRFRDDRLIADSFIKHEYIPFNFFVPLLVLSIIFNLFIFSEAVDATLSKALRIFMIISFSWVLIRVVNVFEDLVEATFDLSKEDNIRERKIRTQLQYIRRIIIMIIFVIAVSVILLSFDSVKQLGAGLLTSAGIAGVIIGFAAQRSLAMFLAGFQIAFTQPIRIDDVLVVEGEWGRVEEITFTYVVLRIWDQRRLILPINYFIEKPFQNWTRISADILGTVYIYADYTIPLEKLRKALTGILKKNEKWDGRVNVLQVTDATEKTVQIRALMSARNSSDAWDLRCFVREELLTYIQQHHPESLPRFRGEWEKKKE